MVSSLIGGETIIRRIPGDEICQALLAGREAQQFEAYRFDTHEAEFVICDQPIDIMYIRLQHGWMYLVAILDWFSRYIVSWELDQTLDLGFVLVAVERARQQAAPQILNSDQGSHFTSPRYLQLLQEAGVQVSMDGKGRAFDNIFTERLWRTIKYECIYIHDLETPKETRQVLTTYLNFYNQQRVHQALGYRTPAEVHFESRS